MALLFRMPTSRRMNLYLKQNIMATFSPGAVHSLVDLRLVYPCILALVKLISGGRNCIADLHYTRTIFSIFIDERVTDTVIDPLYKLRRIATGAVCNEPGKLLFEAVGIF